jgi:hypothetical protein
VGLESASRLPDGSALTEDDAVSEEVLENVVSRTVREMTADTVNVGEVASEIDIVSEK